MRRSAGWRPSTSSNAATRRSATSAARRVRYSRLREASFRKTLAAAGCEVSTCYVDYAPRLPVRTSWKTVNRQIRQWLKDLPKPVAVLAANDVPGRDLASMCHQLESADTRRRGRAGRGRRRVGMPVGLSAAVERGDSGRADRLRGGPHPGPDAGRPAGVARAGVPAAGARGRPAVDQRAGRGGSAGGRGHALHPAARGRAFERGADRDGTNGAAAGLGEEVPRLPGHLRAGGNPPHPRQRGQGVALRDRHEDFASRPARRASRRRSAWPSCSGGSRALRPTPSAANPSCKNASKEATE